MPRQLTKTVLKTALNEERTGYLGYEKHDPAGPVPDIRNGMRGKAALTEGSGQAQIECRGTGGMLTSQIFGKRQRRLTGVDQIVLWWIEAASSATAAAVLMELPTR